MSSLDRTVCRVLARKPRTVVKGRDRIGALLEQARASVQERPGMYRHRYDKYGSPSHEGRHRYDLAVQTEFHRLLKEAGIRVEGADE